MLDAVDVYRRTLKSRKSEANCWRYLSTTTFVTEDHPDINVNHVETAMLLKPVGQNFTHSFRIARNRGTRRRRVGLTITRRVDRDCVLSPVDCRKQRAEAAR